MNQKSLAIRAILFGGLVAGALDAVDGVVAFGLKGFNPIQVLQYIASGLLGPASLQGGLPTAVLGLVLHFLIAFVAAGVYYFASLKVTALVCKAVPSGLLYGVAVYFVMNYIVLPLSAVLKLPFSLPLFLNGVIGHALFVGLPIAIVARRSRRGTECAS